MWRSARLQRHEEDLAAVEALGEILGGQLVVPVKDESGRPTGEHVRASLMERVTACAALVCGGYPEIGDDVAMLLEAAPHDPKVVAQGLLSCFARIAHVDPRARELLRTPAVAAALAAARFGTTLHGDVPPAVD